MATTGKPTLKPKRRPKVTSPLGSVHVLENVALGPPKAPGHLTLRPQDKPFWEDILRARARDEWGRVELVLAAQLARCQADIEASSKLVASGDREAMEEAGFPSVRSVNSNIGTLTARQLSLMRALQIVGTVIGDPVEQMPRRKAEREAEQTIARLKGPAKGRGAPVDADEPPLLSL